MKHRLFTKYFLATGTVVVLSLTIMIMIMTAVYSKYISESKYESLKSSCDSVASFYIKNRSNIIDFESQKGLHYIMGNLSNVSENDMFITDSYGVIRICTCEVWGLTGQCEHTGTRIDKSLLDNAISGSKGELSTLGIYNETRYVSSSKIEGTNGELIGIVIASAPMSNVKALIKSTGKIYLISAIFPLVIIFVCLYITTYRMTKPLKLMSVAAKSMASGDFSKRIPVNSDDEIGELAVSFNQMTNSLSRLENMRKGFIADVSHELRTPMTTIGGFIDGILDGTIEKDKQDYYLKLVSDETKRLSRMVEGMLSVSRLESEEFVLKKENFDFKELLLNIVLGREQQIEQKNIDVLGLEDLPRVTLNADKDLIYRVVYNLVDNALKFTNENGKIRLTINSDSKKMMFTVSNTGTQIASEDLPYIFERFYKTDKSRSENKKGTGLGLYMVKTIIKKHNGQVSCKSNKNGVTTFSVVLPID